MIEAGTLSRLSLFADLRGPQLAAVAELMEEESFPRDARVIRTGLSGGGFFVITGGEASVRIADEERARLGAGDFFGELSVLLDEPAGADVVAASEELRCGVLPGHQLRPLLLDYPSVAVRMLEIATRRLRDANLWAR